MALQRFPKGRARSFSAWGLAAGPRPNSRRMAAVERLETRALLTGGQGAPGQVVPTAHDDVIDTDEGNPVAVNVLANDNVPGGIMFTSLAVGTQPTHGVIRSIDPENGTITYMPGAQFSGTDTFTYSFRDTYGNPSNTATVTVIVNRPVANDDFSQTVSGTPVVVHSSDNDSDPDGNDHLVPSSVSLVAVPLHGTASPNGDGSFTYSANPGFEGTDHFQYTIKDDAGATSNNGTDTIVVTAPPAQPGTILNDDDIDTDAGNPVTIDVLANDVSPVGFNASTVVLASQPSHGAASIDPSTGSVTYTPGAQYFGTDTFTYTVRDSKGGLAGPARVSVVVNRPTANDDFSETFGTTPVTVSALDNDTDPDGDGKIDPSSLRLVSLPAHGLVTYAPGGGLTFVAVGGFSGTDRFSYTVKDLAGATSNVATVSIVVDLGQITGQVFTDSNDNGVQNPGEAGIAGRVFYLDANGDGQRGPDELATSSDAEGRYTFKNLPAGSFVVRQDTSGDPTLVQTSPAGGSIVATITAGSPNATVTAVGNVSLSPISPVQLTPQSFPQGPGDAATKYVQGLYLGILGNDVSASDVASTVAKLNKANTPHARNLLAQLVFDSGTNRANEVTRDFQTLIGRSPTGAEIGALTRGFAASGGSVGVAAKVLSTSAFRARTSGGNAGYVTALYQQSLGRAPTNSELTILTNKLNHRGFTATKAAKAVLTSPDGAGLLVDSLYTSILQRQADASSRAALVDRIVSGRTTVDAIAVSLLASNEYYARAQAAANQG
jgi:Bacterial Ig domain/SdrD B-like domain